jgi:hypothetical protein
MGSRTSDGPACEDCGATTETTGGWGKPSGTAGAATTFAQSVQRADWTLGHRGYLCTRCWWGRQRRAA